MAVWALGVAPLVAQGGAVLKAVPGEIDPRASFMFYLHGKIVEDQGMRPTHPQHGVYEYQAVLLALATAEFNVISEARPAGSEIATYADRVVGQIATLRAAGVPEQKISVVGFSKGGAIAVAVATRVGEASVRYILLAGCFAPMAADATIRPKGKFLSFLDTADDQAVPCGDVLDRKLPGFTLVETKLKTGLGHGAFYRPDPVWVSPLTNWLKTGRRNL